MNTLIVYIIISFTNVFLHITRSIFVIKSGKFIAETDIYTAIAVQATTNFIGCYLAMLVCEKLLI